MRSFPPEVPYLALMLFAIASVPSFAFNPALQPWSSVHRRQKRPCPFQFLKAESDNNVSSEPVRAAAGPKSESSSSRRRRSTSSTTGRRRSKSSANTGRRRTASPPAGQYAVASKRAPHQFDHTKEQARPFTCGKTEVAEQVPNEDAPVFPLPEGVAPGFDGEVISHDHIETTSLDDLFPGLGFSSLFASSKEFRTELRAAMREDIFDTTPAYASMSEKARKMLLLPDSSLQGSWKCRDGRWVRKDDKRSEQDEPRMTKLTEILTKFLGEDAPTGDEFMDIIGSLCGSSPSTHWIDIVGVQDRRIPHSWHQDTGRSPNGDTKTVLLAFPPEDNYNAVGVFSHVVKLEKERHAADDHPPNEPVVHTNMEIEDKYIVRPSFSEGREIIYYRDIDVLHSSPDVAYRASVMRFM
uniref:Uncharacterized protein n=1 Tax=Trieres chinensis TaxID=1514140 RepID=A0A7S2EJB6_TRICV|mmetsp:Transcript_26809/g.54878  ORF Transcript_26809/g.54878 Transcript_26809/m.54878 type:complete len:410 (+) Transcript_26809:150-1379(+)|eukprot:CAMPEP_0183310664 /NCGR_PEP_ID=MMETSP0160_2-20130417/32576_1 /TAXON_ID=2839 ORGANISM="Odontella Sinensis, Strain Grunow 1884" /NCGR_SAMPLE_ID=MMETSP0160_2 /ASSEMBLY_ACC=CAM_ASM_000250 /LENGTH=409 /DNA_ID=CAMNT_0025474973 /DNA_START=96 /DNA_END=1325 /DNA_ORIENTATION=+